MIPTPPVTINAPVVVEVDTVAFVMFILLVVVNPLSVTDCNVLVFQIVTAPDDVLIDVSVPDTILDTPKFPTPFIYKLPPILKSPPIPTPPTTVNAPVFVEVDTVVPANVNVF